MSEFYVSVLLALLCSGRNNCIRALWKENDVILINNTGPTPAPSDDVFVSVIMHNPVSLEISQIKYMAKIFVGENHACSGAYIRPFWILTPASCISDYFEEDYVVYMGSDLLGVKEGQSRTVQKLIPHFQFSQYPERNNIGLIKLSEPFDLGPTVGIIETVPSERNNGTCSLIGWGLTVLALQIEGRWILEHMTIEVIDGELCQMYFAAHEVPADLDDTVVCVTTNIHHDFCMADVGTTLTCGGMLFGITSVSVNCLQGLPLLVFKVPSFNRWIEQKIMEYNIIEDELDSNSRINGQLTLPLLFTLLNKVFFQYR